MTKPSNIRTIVISFLWVSLFAYSPVWGQCLSKDAVSFNNPKLAPYHYACEFTNLDTPYKEKKLNGGYVGARLVFIGLGVGLYAVVNGVIHGDGPPVYSTQGFTQSQSLINGAICFGGLGLMVFGLELAYQYDMKHKVTIVSSGNQVGIAYNFR